MLKPSFLKVKLNLLCLSCKIRFHRVDPLKIAALLQYAAIWRHVLWYGGTTVPEQVAVSIFRAAQAHSGQL